MKICKQVRFCTVNPVAEVKIGKQVRFCAVNPVADRAPISKYVKEVPGTPCYNF